MNKVLRASAVVAAAGLMVPFWAAPSYAESASEAASVGAYYYSLGIDKPEQSPTQPPPITQNNTDMVAPDHLAVAVRTPGRVDKLSFLSFDLASVPFDATITKAVVTVPLATEPGNTQTSPAAEKVTVCMAGDEGFNGEDGANTSGAPSTLCDKFKVVGKESADKKSYEFDVSTLAASWLTDANNGLALTPSALTSPFQVVFKPMADATIALTFTAPVEDVVTDVVAPDTSVTTPDSGTGFSGSTGTFDAALPVPETGGFGAVESPVVDTALPAPAPQTMEAPAPAVAPTAVQNVALVKDVPLTPAPSFWLGMLAVAALLALLSLILGDSRIPAQSTGSGSRLSKALQQRETVSARGPRMAARPLGI